MTFPLLVALMFTGSEPLPTALPFDLSSRTIVLGVHATGAQIYECRAMAGKAPEWSFREPIAALFKDGKTIGRHYAGPAWALDDGSVVTGKQDETRPGPSSSDIAQLKLDVVAHPGYGQLDAATNVYRVNTRGGKLAGPCPAPGMLQAVPYSADYLFAK